MSVASIHPAAPAFKVAPLYWLALGAFAVGTEGFMIAAILPRLAHDLSVGVGTAGQLVTIFALAYAISSPILTALSGKIPRRALLIGALGLFALANLLAACATTYAALAAARVLLAFFAGLYVPGANALAGALAPVERRGRAIAIVNTGITVAIALGVPLGALVGAKLGWRMTFAGVSALSLIATLGLVVGLPKTAGAGLAVPGLMARLAAARRPGVLPALLVTTLWAIGAYAIYTYIAPFMAAVLDVSGPRLGAILFLWGLSAGVGLALGGGGNDKIGSNRVIIIALVLAASAMIVMSTSGHWLSSRQALAPVLLAVAVWGAAHWGFWPAQQTRLMQVAGLSNAPVVLSLNASFMYLGFSLGAAAGSLTLAHASVLDLGYVGAGFVALSLGLFLLALRRHSKPETAGGS